MPETSTAGDIAELLKDYIPRAEYEATLEALDATVKERDEHRTAAEKHGGRAAELEKKVRARSARDAFDKVADKLKIDGKFKDDVFRLADVPTDADEPDAGAIEKHLSAFLKEKPHFLAPEPTKPKTIPAGEGHSRGPSVRPGEPELRVRRTDLGNALYMRDNQKRIAEAQKAGVLVIDDD
jgi:hypothetical protein